MNSLLDTLCRVRKELRMQHPTNEDFTGLCDAASQMIINKITKRHPHIKKIRLVHGVVILPEQKYNIENLSEEEFFSLPQHTWVEMMIHDDLYECIDITHLQFAGYFKGNGFDGLSFQDFFGAAIVSKHLPIWLLPDKFNPLVKKYCKKN